MSLKERLDATEDGEPIEEIKQDATPIHDGSDLQFPDAAPGTCQVCGNPAVSKYGKFCEDHKASHDKRRTAGGTSAKSKPVTRKATKDLRSDLQASFAMAGMAWSMTGPKLTPDIMVRLFPELSPEQVANIHHPGHVLTAQAEQMADAMAHLAEQNPRIAKWLEAASSPSGYLAVGMAVLPVVASVQQWHMMVIPRVKQLQAEMEAESHNGG